MKSQKYRLKNLGNFLKSRRARLTPKDVGLPENHSKRRTLGLKREEVSLLAGVSITWYTWLEQGREINVSKQVLQSIARALQLNDDEYSHLLHLAGLSGSTPSSSTHDLIPSSLQKILDNLPYPAMIVNHRSDVLAWNSISCQYFVDFSKLPKKERNMLWQLFTNDSLRKRISNWEECANYAVSIIRVFYDLNPNDLQFAINNLMNTSSYFNQQWNQYEISKKSDLIIKFSNGKSFEVTSLHHRNGTEDLQLFICVQV